MNFGCLVRPKLSAPLICVLNPMLAANGIYSCQRRCGLAKNQLRFFSVFSSMFLFLTTTKQLVNLRAMG